MSIVSDLFDRLLALAPGERITIPFDSQAELRSKKTMLYKEKRAYELSLKGKLLRKSIFITEEVVTKEGMFKLHLSTSAETMGWLSKAVLVSDEGAVKPLKVTVDRDVKLKESEQERIQRLQSEDIEETN